MSRVRFLADHDLTEAIVLGVRRREPTMEFLRLRDVGLADRPDNEVLEHAAGAGFLLVSHDVNTMAAHASARLKAGLSMPGVFLAHSSRSDRPDD
jgi:predicted nuclease of predicted toxin-antitoxin system